MLKKDIRDIVRDRKRQFTQEQLEELSLSLITRLQEHPRVKAAKTLLLYYSLPDEVNTHELINILAKQGKKVLLPKVIDKTDMEIRVYSGPEDLVEGCYHIMEPAGQLFTDYQSIDLAIIPGMSFDSNNNRLGRGKGYYDRFLPKIPDAYKIGICFDFQKFPEIPAGNYDFPMDEVI